MYVQSLIYEKKLETEVEKERRTDKTNKAEC